MDFWENKSYIWSEIRKHKPICVETKDNEAFKATMTEYYKNVDDKKGAVFMAVLRGKVSEGLDFADMYGRAVVIVGIPYAYMADPKVILKKEYLNSRNDIGSRNVNGGGGDEWYELDAIRAVNQAIGRVIRHKFDYGAILLCDFRYNGSIQNNISTWVKDRLRTSSTQKTGFSSIIAELKTFFNNCAEQVVEFVMLKSFKTFSICFVYPVAKAKTKAGPRKVYF